jgi:hypothetical protein
MVSAKTVLNDLLVLCSLPPSPVGGLRAEPGVTTAAAGVGAGAWAAGAVTGAAGGAGAAGGVAGAAGGGGVAGAGGSVAGGGCWKMLLDLPRPPVCWVGRELCQDPHSRRMVLSQWNIFSLVTATSRVCS